MDIFCVKISSKLSFIILYLKAAVCFVWHEVSQTQILLFTSPAPDVSVIIFVIFADYLRKARNEFSQDTINQQTVHQLNINSKP